MSENDYNNDWEAEVLDDLIEDSQEDIFESTNASEKESNILEFIGHSPVEIDELVKISGINIKTLNGIILEHELNGELTRHPGNKVSKVS